MRNGTSAASKPGHITKGDVLEDLGLSREELVGLKVKSELWRELMAHIKPLALTQKELAFRLEIHQPEVSQLLAGKLSKFSAGTLIQYAVRLNLGVEVRITSRAKQKGKIDSVHGKASRTKARGGMAGAVSARA